jgi:hypothetical protein
MTSRDGTDRGYDDGYSDMEFPALHRIARLNEILNELKAAGIGLLANEYLRRRNTATFPFESVFTFTFAPIETRTTNVPRSPYED